MNEEELEKLIRKELNYLLEEGVVVIDKYTEMGEPVYRMKTEEEIQKELEEIQNL